MSSMIRTAEFYGFRQIYIYDANKLLQPPTNKKGRADMEHLARVWTAGAVDHIDIITIDDPLAFLGEHKGRIVGTLVNDSAVHLTDFAFDEGDLILFGSEKEGLPVDIQALLDERIYIPAKGHTNCLNVAVTFGIVVQAAAG